MRTAYTDCVRITELPPVTFLKPAGIMHNTHSVPKQLPVGSILDCVNWVREEYEKKKYQLRSKLRKARLVYQNGISERRKWSYNQDHFADQNNCCKPMNSFHVYFPRPQEKIWAVCYFGGHIISSAKQKALWNWTGQHCECVSYHCSVCLKRQGQCSVRLGPVEEQTALVPLSHVSRPAYKIGSVGKSISLSRAERHQNTLPNAGPCGVHLESHHCRVETGGLLRLPGWEILPVSEELGCVCEDDTQCCSLASTCEHMYNVHTSKHAYTCA